MAQVRLNKKRYFRSVYENESSGLAVIFMDASVLTYCMIWLSLLKNIHNIVLMCVLLHYILLTVLIIQPHPDLLCGEYHICFLD